MLGRDQPGFACRMDVDHLRFPAEPCRLGRGGFDRAPAAGDEAVVGVPFRRLVRLYRFAPARARRGYPVSVEDRGSEEHTSELQSLMRNSYAVFCLKKKTKYNQQSVTTTSTLSNQIN